MIEESVLKEIEHLKRKYREKEKVFSAERVKLQELVEKYLDENDIQNNLKQLEEIAEILPGCLIRDNLLERLCGLKFKEKEREMVHKRGQKTAAAESGIKGDRISYSRAARHFKEAALRKNALKEIKRQGIVYREKEKEFNALEKNLEEYVESYLNRKDAWNDIEKLDEVINVLPGSMLRFWLIDRKLSLSKNPAQQQCVQKSIEIQEIVDESQVSGDSQITDMGGMTF